MKHFAAVLAGLLIALSAVPTQVAAAEIDLSFPIAINCPSDSGLHNDCYYLLEFNLFGEEAQQREVHGILEAVKLTAQLNEIGAMFSGNTGNVPFGSSLAQLKFHYVVVNPGNVGLGFPASIIFLPNPCGEAMACDAAIVNRTPTSVAERVPDEFLSAYSLLGTGSAVAAVTAAGSAGSSGSSSGHADGALEVQSISTEKFPNPPHSRFPASP